MTNPHHIVLRVVRILVMLTAYAYLLYLLFTYQQWPELLHHLGHAGSKAYCCLALAVLLIPINLLLEAIKWKSLLTDCYSMSLAEAQRQVYMGLYGAFLTPQRVGEYPARVTAIPDRTVWPKAIGQGFVGSAALTAVNIAMGLLAFACSSFRFPGLDNTWIWLVALSLLAAMLVVVAWIQRYRSPMIFALSFLRYLVFAAQFMLVLLFCTNIAWRDMLLLIPIYYMFVTVLPVIPAADPAIKGSVSALVFALATPDTTSVAVAAILIWLLNTIFPMLYSIFLQKKA